MDAYLKCWLSVHEHVGKEEVGVALIRATTPFGQLPGKAYLVYVCVCRCARVHRSIPEK